MSVELNRTTFRRLIQLYLLSLMLHLLALGYEEFSPRWSEFYDNFTELSEQHFGTINDSWILPLGIWVAVVLIWALAATLGLFWFKRWARFGFWASLVVFLPAMFLPGVYPVYSAPLSDLLAMVEMSLFGAILLLAYSREHGAIWFADSAQSVKEDSNGRPPL